VLNTAFNLSKGTELKHTGNCIVHPIALHTVALEQGIQPASFPIYEAKPVALFDQGIQYTFRPDLDPQTMNELYRP